MSKSETKFLVTFGKNLAEIRRKKNISQEQLAYESDISLSTISKIERGILNISISNVYRIAKALNVHYKELFAFDLLTKNR